MKTVYEITQLSPAGQIAAIRQGFTAKEADSIRSSLGISQKSLFMILGTPDRTGKRLLKEDRFLDPASSERLLRLVEVEQHAIEAFGQRDLAVEWMKKHNLVLGCAPVDLLDTEIGHKEVRRLLLAIEHGLPV